MDLPVTFQENMKQLLKEEYEEYLKSFEEKRVYGLRVNTLKITTEQFEKICPFTIHKIPWISNGYYYEEQEKPAKHPYYFAGLYYLQEPSAMTPAEILPIEPGDKVLDVCAAPGGKSTELAAKLKGEGVLISNDISNSRAKALLKNLELFGISNAFVMSENPAKLTGHFCGYFDKILVDAPCSGEGMFRKEPGVMKSWIEHGNEFYAKLQKDIVKYALQMLKPGGMLLYSTCTFSPLENETSVKYMLDLCKELELVTIPPYEGFGSGMPETVDGPEELKKCVRIWPQRMKGEGHFLALLKKGEAKTKQEPVKVRNDRAEIEKKSPEFFEFLKDISKKFELSDMELRGDRIFCVPDRNVDLKGLRIMRSGLLMGECKKNRFEPSQALAMTLKKEEYQYVVDFELNDPRVIKYLKGETLDVSDLEKTLKKAWYLICVDGFPLGFAKGSRTMLKNKYLSGWRWQ